MNINVLILSAGIGSRLKSKSQKPKSLIKISNLTLIERLINKLINLGIKNFYITVGYKKKLIIKQLTKYEKKINIKYIHIKNYENVGSSYSFFRYKNYWEKNKNDTLFLHSDLFCHESLIDDVFNSKYKNIIGSFKKKTKSLKKGWLINFNSNNKIKSIQKTLYKKNRYFYEISCINKFSSSYMKKLFKLMDGYIQNVSDKDTWEILINKFIKVNKMSFYSNISKDAFWFNINTIADLRKAKNYANKMKVK